MFFSIKYIFQLFALLILCFPNFSTAGEEWTSEDWYGAWFSSTTSTWSPDGYGYLICFLRDENNIIVKHHRVIGKVNNLEISDQVTFKFNNSTSIIVPVASLDDLPLSGGQDFNVVRFIPLDDITDLENYMKNGLSFSVYVKDKILFGPFSLKGSRTAINRVRGFLEHRHTVPHDECREYSKWGIL